MTDTKTVMQQALDALKECYGHDKPSTENRFEAISELKAAIAQPEQQANKLPPLPVAVSQAIDAYWSHGYGEGRTGIDNGTTGNAILAELVGAIRDYAREATAQPVQPACSDHPNAPHGFVRNASHSAHRYVCECEGWEPSVIAPPWKVGNEYLPYDPHAAHVEHDYRDGWNACYESAIAQPKETK